jgi:hypothetical protein
MIFKILSNLSGLSKLVDRYKTDLNPANLSLTGQTIQIGMVKYRKCVSFRADEAGLFLHIKVSLWKSRQILIPWKDMSQAGFTKIYWESAVSFNVGETYLATIAVPLQMFYLMKPFIRDSKMSP